jgi:tetratricopeptide (TPR) repeat protein
VGTAVRIAAALIAVFGLSGISAAVDAQSLMWLKTGQYSKLEAHLESLQRGYESSQVPESKLYEGFRDLYEDRAENATYYDRWIQAYPSSYVARTARGAYRLHMASYVRGVDFISQTPPQQIERMLAYLTQARQDLQASLKMTAKPYLSTLYLLNAARYSGTAEERRQWLDAGNAIDPHNELLRLRYLNCLTPRRGGSLQQMWEFRAENARRQVPAELLRRFDITIHDETAQILNKQRNFAAAFTEWSEVLKLSATDGAVPSDEALMGYARSAWELHRRTDADRGLQLLAQRQIDEGWVLSQMGWIYTQENRIPEAWAVLQRAASLNDAWAQFSVGKTTYLGCADIHLAANHRAGLAWIRRSADQGFAEAKVFLMAHP